MIFSQYPVPFLELPINSIPVAHIFIRFLVAIDVICLTSTLQNFLAFLATRKSTASIRHVSIPAFQTTDHKGTNGSTIISNSICIFKDIVMFYGLTFGYDMISNFALRVLVSELTTPAHLTEKVKKL